MPKKRPPMQLLTIAEQQELIARFQSRHDVRDANRELARLVLNWITGGHLTQEEFMEQLEAGGHEGEYHHLPSVTTRERAMAQASKLPNIVKRLDDTPLDYMGAIELSYVYERIREMIATLEDHPRGTMQTAIDLYRSVGGSIRRKVFTETGHYPEQFPIASGRITGKESPKQFQLQDHQPQLF